MPPTTQREIVFHPHDKQWENKHMSSRGLLQLTNEVSCTRVIRFPTKFRPSHTDKNLAEMKPSLQAEEKYVLEKKCKKKLALWLQSKMWVAIHMCKRGVMMGGMKGGKVSDLKGWNADRTELLMSQNFRYTHRSFQTLIAAGHLKVKLKPLSQTLIKQASERKREESNGHCRPIVSSWFRDVHCSVSLQTWGYFLGWADCFLPLNTKRECGETFRLTALTEIFRIRCTTWFVKVKLTQKLLKWIKSESETC